METRIYNSMKMTSSVVQQRGENGRRLLYRPAASSLKLKRMPEEERNVKGGGDCDVSRNNPYL
jgi:hypothetical protein